jgi:hypothetical protein
MTFFITVGNSNTYDEVMKFLTEQGLTFSSDFEDGYTRFEIMMANEAHYNHFKQMISENKILARLTEAY